MTKGTEKRVIAFVSTIAKRCSSCLYRNEENCRTCISMWANSIMTDIDADREGKFIDNSIGARTEQIMIQLMRANRPLMSNEIDIRGLCSFQLKLWTLKRLCKRGILGRKIAKVGKRHKFYFYFIKNKQRLDPAIMVATKQKEVSGNRPADAQRELVRPPMRQDRQVDCQ